MVALSPRLADNLIFRLLEDWEYRLLDLKGAFTA